MIFKKKLDLSKFWAKIWQGRIGLDQHLGPEKYRLVHMTILPTLPVYIVVAKDYTGKKR